MTNRQDECACASKTLRRLTWALLILPVLAGLARADELPPDPVNPKGHVGDVLALGFTPDGKTLITTGSDGLAKIWDVATRTVRADLTGHEGKVLRVAISSDGKTIATGGEDRTVRLWSTADGARLGTLSGHSGAVTALAFAPDGKTLASGSPDTTIRLWDVAARRALRTLEGHDAGVQGLAFSPDGKTLASASRDGTVRLWDVDRRAPADAPRPAERTGLVRGLCPRWQDRRLRRPGQDGAVLADRRAQTETASGTSATAGSRSSATATTRAVAVGRERCARDRVRARRQDPGRGRVRRAGDGADSRFGRDRGRSGPRQSSGALSRAIWVRSRPWRSRPMGRRSPRAAPIARSGSGISRPGRREPSGWAHAPPDPCRTGS